MVEHKFKWKNDGRTKVMVGCGTRPEIIRLAAVIKRCREYFDCCVVYYNQNWDRNLSTVFWEDFELKNTFGEFGGSSTWLLPWDMNMCWLMRSGIPRLVETR